MEETKSMTETVTEEIKSETETAATAEQKTEAALKQMVRRAKQAYGMAVHADDQVLDLWSKGKLDTEEFTAITGYSPVTALRRRYAAGVLAASMPLRAPVAAGLITEEEYEDITGAPYMRADAEYISRAVTLLDEINPDEDAKV